MQNRLFNVLFIVVIALVLANCANRGTPTGGEKDITPPEITKTIPENYSTHFTGDEIKIYFNEYVKLKNLSKQLIVSPPMNTAPEITPLGTASKYITIKIYDTLQPNTTYAFNFGNSIVDNNEENPYTYYRYVFSTGDYIDSLTVKGQVMDAIKFKADDFVSVLLYEADSTYTDSLIYKKTPNYVTNTLDSTTNFTIENIKAGKYYLRALKDENSDNKFQQRSDKIAFYKDIIEVSNDTTAFYELKLFSEQLDYKAYKPRLVSGEKIVFGYQGDYKETKIEVLSDVPTNYTSRYYKDKETDSLNYFYLPKLEIDSLIFKISNKTVIDTFTVNIKENKRDSLLIKPYPTGGINFKEDFTLTGNIPFKTLNKEKITIIDKDSLSIPFTTVYDSLQNKYNISFDKTEENTYKINLMPEALIDFFENKNDTLNYSVRTQTEYSYGNARVILKNAVYPLIIQLTNDKGEIKAEQYVTEPKPIDFEFIDPSKYYLRVIFDTNKNGIYDSGNYLKGIQPERVSYYPELIELRSGFDDIFTFTLLD